MRLRQLICKHWAPSLYLKSLQWFMPFWVCLNFARNPHSGGERQRGTLLCNNPSDGLLESRKTPRKIRKHQETLNLKKKEEDYYNGWERATSPLLNINGDFYRCTIISFNSEFVWWRLSTISFWLCVSGCIYSYYFQYKFRFFFFLDKMLRCCPLVLHAWPTNCEMTHTFVH